MLNHLEYIASGVATVALAASAVVIGESRVEYKSMFVNTPVGVEAPNQLARNFKHKLMVDHNLVSGKVTKKGEPKQGSFQEMTSQFIPYTIKTKTGEIYNAASREQDIFNVGDDVTALLGWPLDCDCEVLGRIIEAYQK